MWGFLKVDILACFTCVNGLKPNFTEFSSGWFASQDFVSIAKLKKRTLSFHCFNKQNIVLDTKQLSTVFFSSILWYLKFVKIFKKLSN
jgi:hypothetical protein